MCVICKTTISEIRVPQTHTHDNIYEFIMKISIYKQRFNCVVYIYNIR